MASAAAAVAAADSFDDLPSKEDIKKEFYGLLEGVGKLLDYTYVETDETIGPQGASLSRRSDSCRSSAGSSRGCATRRAQRTRRTWSSRS
jgi:hypothetical protein